MISLKRSILMGLAVVFLVSLPMGLRAQEGIKARMKSRLPEIVKLKNQGFIGESNRGYLAWVTSKRVKTRVIDDENKDRKTVYQKIAGHQGVPLSTVETLRARQIRENAGKGDFLQHPDGSWYQK